MPLCVQTGPVRVPKTCSLSATWAPAEFILPMITLQGTQPCVPAGTAVLAAKSQLSSLTVHSVLLSRPGIACVASSLPASRQADRLCMGYRGGGAGTAVSPPFRRHHPLRASGPRSGVPRRRRTGGTVLPQRRGPPCAWGSLHSPACASRVTARPAR